MDLTKKEVNELQEQIIIIYKVIHQDNTFNSFYFKDMDVNMPKSESNLVNKLGELENAEEILRRCIVELEEIKRDEKLPDKVFYEIMAGQDLKEIYTKYNVKGAGDLDRLNIKELIEIL